MKDGEQERNGGIDRRTVKSEKSMTENTDGKHADVVKRRTILKGAAAVSGAGLVGVSATGTVTAEEVCGPGCEPQCEAEVPLCAGQHTEVGTVYVRRVPGENEIEVEYVLDGDTENDWYLRETHLYVGKTDPTELSTAPGQFPFSKQDYGDSVTEDTYTIGFDEICEYTTKGGGGKWEETNKCGVDEGDCVWVAAHAVVDEVLIEAPYFAANAEYKAVQGVQKNDDSIDSDRSNPEDALVKAYPDGNFFSLGFEPDGEGGFEDEGGWIEVTFDCPVVNGEGDDLRLWEVTFADYPEEKADVYAWYEGDWRLLGTADNSGQGDTGSPEAHTLSTFDLGSPADEDYDEIESTEKLKIVDTTDPSLHNGSADAFDLDGIEVLQDCTKDETAWGDGCDGCEITDGGNWATYFQYGIGGFCEEEEEIVGTINLSYEDLPVDDSDWDVNDWVVDLIGTFNAAGTTDDGTPRVTEFTFDIVPQARGAGDDHEWKMLFPSDVLCGSGSYDLTVKDSSGNKIGGKSESEISFNGSSEVDITVFPSTAAVYDDLANAERPGNVGECTEPREWATLTVTFDDPCAIDVPTDPVDVGVNGGGLFFDPYLVNLAKSVEVHKDDVRLVTVPDDWKWPLGAVQIWDAYDDVSEDEGKPSFDEMDWYLAENVTDEDLVTSCDFDPEDLN